MAYCTTIHFCRNNCLKCKDYPKEEYCNCPTYKWRKGIIEDGDFEKHGCPSNPATYYDDIKKQADEVKREIEKEK